MSNRSKYWTGLVESWEKSGLTQAEFCRRRGVTAVTFGWWKRKLRGTGERANPRSSRSTTTRRRPEAKFAEVMWSDGVRDELDELSLAGDAPVVACPAVSVGRTPEGFCGGYEIVFTDGLLIRLPGDFDPEKVSQLIGLVAPRC